MSAHKFQMTFANGLRCTITFDPAIHWNEQTQCAKPVKKWFPKPQYEDPDSIMPQYVEWRHTVNSQIAKIVNAAHIYLITDSHAKRPRWTIWRYYPNGKKKVVKKGDGIFDPYA